jgi:hypothetical protein
MRLTRKLIEQEIKIQTGYDVVLTKGDGYFWFSSDDEKTGLMLAGKQSTSIYQNTLGQQSLQEWVDSFITIIKND